MSTVRISAEQVRTLTDARLVNLRSEAIRKSKSASTPDERNKWSKFILLSDIEIGRRKTSTTPATTPPSKRPVRGRSKAPVADEGADLARRITEVREDLYGDSSRRDARRKAAQVKAEMRSGR